MTNVWRLIIFCLLVCSINTSSESYSFSVNQVRGHRERGKGEDSSNIRSLIVTCPLANSSAQSTPRAGSSSPLLHCLASQPLESTIWNNITMIFRYHKMEVLTESNSRGLFRSIRIQQSSSPHSLHTASSLLVRALDRAGSEPAMRTLRWFGCSTGGVKLGRETHNLSMYPLTDSVRSSLRVPVTVVDQSTTSSVHQPAEKSRVFQTHIVFFDLKVFAF